MGLGINVLSLFDGISGTQEALKEMNVNVNNYYASEINKHTIAITQYQFPNTIQIGDVCKVSGKELPSIDLMTWGSPCSDLSSAGKQKGLGGEHSILFWEAVRLWKVIKPKYFLMENVASMKNSDRDIISNTLGVIPIKINSALLSAQYRNRYYWTNINGVEGLFKNDIPQPINKNIFLKDIILTTVQKDNTIILNTDKQIKKFNNIKVAFDKSNCLTQALSRGGSSSEYITVLKQMEKLTGVIRSLYPIECERLQTFPDDYTKIGNYGGIIKEVSKTHRMNALGNSFTVAVIKHILSFANL